MAKESHIERTASEPRDASLHRTTIARVDEINHSIRVFCLGIPNGETIKFLPGQWLDVYLPAMPKPGGFTITSTPSQALDRVDPYLELAVQRSPENPAAAWLWQPVDTILRSVIKVRVGGSFVWPPLGVGTSGLRRVIFVAGGVGVNPLMSMLSSLAEPAATAAAAAAALVEKPLEVHFLYSMRDPGTPRDVRAMLFVERIANIFACRRFRGKFRLFLTRDRSDDEHGHASRELSLSIPIRDGVHVPVLQRRISVRDVADILDGEKDSAVVYVCGVPAMTDEFVEKLVNEVGMEPRRVLFEKWW